MVAITTNDLKTGMTLQLDNGLFNVIDFQHVKPGKGPAFVRTTLKNARSGAQLERTFRAGEKVERANIDKRDMQFLYRSGDDFVFMDNESYDQMEIAKDQLGDAPNYLIENSSATLMMYEGEIIGTDIPASVELLVAETEPGLQGDRSSGGTKPATMETGLNVQVPLFIETGEKLKIDTRSGDYIGRA